MSTALAPSTSPACWAAASAAASTSSALAVASWTFITERIWAGIFGSMLWHWSSMNATPASGPQRVRGNHLVQDAEQLERVGRADHQVVVGVEAAS